MPDGYDTMVGENGVRLSEEKSKEFLLLEQYLKIVALF